MGEMDIERLIEAVRGSRLAEVWYQYKLGVEVAADASSEPPAPSKTLLPTPDSSAQVQQPQLGCGS